MANHARNLSREAHLWYTLTSSTYIDQARDHLQRAHDYMYADVQADNSSLAGEYPPVAHWGNAMLDLLDSYSQARALLRQGEFSAINVWCSKLMDIPRGLREGLTSWMDHVDEFWAGLDAAYGICSRFSRSLAMSMMYADKAYQDGSQDWRTCIPEDMGIPGDHIARYYEEQIFPRLPAQAPEYSVDKSLSCKTGEVVPWTGVWVPSAGMGKAALAFVRQGLQIMQPAYQLVVDDEETGEEEYELEECLWHPVRPTGRMIPYPTDPAKVVPQIDRLRCEAGQACPREGWWETPAKENSRRLFKLGEPMPDLGSDYGLTIWQWADIQ